MIKKSILVLLLSTILISQVIITIHATEVEEQLFKFGSKEKVILHDEVISIPKECKNKKDEFRGIWVSTVANIDFPSKETLKDKKIEKEEYINDFNKILDRAQELNLNAIIFQVSPMLDAWYNSEFNPWSQYLVGKQGEKPNFGQWDSLKWTIEETHRRGLEFHAWFNPYRVTNDSNDKRNKNDKLYDLAKNNFAVKNRDAVYEFENRLYLDPGNPLVTEHIVNTIEEILNNYDVDAIHFDDYFYPYKFANKMTGNDNPPDKSSFDKFSNGINDINVWRRTNIDNMIYSVKKIIDKYNNDNMKSVELGISPFGIWGHASKTNGLGSHTPEGATSSYDDYVDSIKWAKEGWVDYLIPQVYWSFSNKSAPYGELVDWWANEFSKIENSHLYIGHANYKHISNLDDMDWKNPKEILTQLKFNQKYSEIKGSAFFSFKNIITYSDGQGQDYEISNKSIKSIQENPYKLPANIPAKPWLDKSETKPVKDLDIKREEDSILIEWKDNNKDSKFYVIYREEGSKDNVDATNPQNIIGRIGVEENQFIDDNIELNKSYTYGITILDEAGIETDSICINTDNKSMKNSILSINASKVGLILGGALILLCSILGIFLSSFI